MNRDIWEDKLKTLVSDYLYSYTVENGDDVDTETLDSQLAIANDMFTNVLDRIRCEHKKQEQRVIQDATEELAELLTQIGDLGNWYFGFRIPSPEGVEKLANDLVIETYNRVKETPDLRKQYDLFNYLISGRRLV